MLCVAGRRLLSVSQRSSTATSFVLSRDHTLFGVGDSSSAPKSVASSRLSSFNSYHQCLIRGRRNRHRRKLLLRLHPHKLSVNSSLRNTPALILACGHGANGSMAHDGDSNNSTIFVGGLDPDTTDEDLRQPFYEFGEVVSVKIPLGKGCGFVQFANRKSAEDAIESLNGTVIGKVFFKESSVEGGGEYEEGQAENSAGD